MTLQNSHVAVELSELDLDRVCGGGDALSTTAHPARLQFVLLLFPSNGG